MNRLYVPARRTEDWKRLLADPEKHWKEGHSAFECATSWERAQRTDRGLPPEVAVAFDSSPETLGASLLLGVPEHQVELDGGGHASQSDLWALVGMRDYTISVAFEAKAGEALGDWVGEWLAGAAPGSGKPARMLELRRLLALADEDLDHVRYQLLHRAASALKEGVRYRARLAALVILAYGGQRDDDIYREYCAFAGIMGAAVGRGRVSRCKKPCAIPLLLGWVDLPVAG